MECESIVLLGGERGLVPDMQFIPLILYFLLYSAKKVTAVQQGNTPKGRS